MSRYPLSKEEIQVLEECNRESFYKRCLPSMAAMAAGTMFAIRTGYLGNPNSKFATAAKVTVAATLGFFWGKVSYLKECENKLIALPDSPLGERIRKRRETEEVIYINGKPYRLSQAELQAIDECNSESFLYRSIPCSIVLGGLVHVGIDKGYLKTNKVLGSFPKIFLACLLGHFLGQFSYTSECAEKFMKIPDSQIGHILKKKV